MPLSGRKGRQGDLAEEEGFEPPIPFQVRQFSRLEPSTTRPLFLAQVYTSGILAPNWFHLVCSGYLVEAEPGVTFASSGAEGLRCPCAFSDVFDTTSDLPGPAVAGLLPL